MGYIIMSRLSAQGDRSYVAWVDDDQPIMEEMARWMRTGECFEILDYVQNEDRRHAYGKTVDTKYQLYDPTTRIYRWRDAFNREKLEQEYD